MSDYPILALCCSAGGLPALETVLAPLPAELPAAVLILQHMSPDNSSKLPAILGRGTALALEWAEDGHPLQPGHALVAPPGQHTLVTKDETIALIPSGSVPPYRPSADLLLTTLAVVAGPRVVAVVLSGEGQDAATGATAVHRFGGTVIVASPETSARKSMPSATMIRDSITDHVVPLDDLPAMLLALTTVPLIDPGNGRRPAPA
jgi:two-component system chemotaxis response regulator CheB